MKLQLLATYPDQPILLLWDRAKWHQGPVLKAFLLAHPRLEILFFPPASPDLNPQEHVWKATREAISHNHVQTNLERLADQFEDHLSTTRFPVPCSHNMPSLTYVRRLIDLSISTALSLLNRFY